MLSCSIALMVAAILIVASISAFTTTASAQQGEVQVESRGDLEATLNGEVFRTGDTITVSGTIEDPSIQSFVTIEVIDPAGETVVQAYPKITADDTFTYSFVAGEEDGFEMVDPMVRSGNYRMIVSFFEGRGDFDIYKVEFRFGYAATPSSSQSQAPVEPGAGGAAAGINPQEESITSLSVAFFQSNVDGIRVGIPTGWVVEDRNNTDPGILQAEHSYGAGVLIELCPINQATPQIGSTYLCPEAEEGSDSVSVWRFADLKSRPEFAGVVQQNKNITTTDLVAFYFLFLEQKANFTDFRLLQNIDTTVAVIDPQTNQTITLTPAKYIQTTYQDLLGTPNNEDFALLVLSDDGNSAYALLPVTSVLTTEGQLPAEHLQVFESFELVAANNTNASNATTINTSQLSPLQQQLLQQQQGQQAPPSQLSQQQQGGQSDTSSSSSGDSNNRGTATNDDSDLDSLTEPLEDLFS
jgi:hypothetical protein